MRAMLLLPIKALIFAGFCYVTFGWLLISPARLLGGL